LAALVLFIATVAAVAPVVLLLAGVGCPYVGAHTAGGPWWANTLLASIGTFTVLAAVGTLGAPIAAILVLSAGVRVQWAWLAAIAAAPLISFMGMWALVQFDINDVFRPLDVDWRWCGDAL
jgi:hypothetical protein